jgi:hypothetical protein
MKNKMRFSPESFNEDTKQLSRREFEKKHGEQKVQYWDRANHERINYDDYDSHDYYDDYDR